MYIFASIWSHCHVSEWKHSLIITVIMNETAKSVTESTRKDVFERDGRQCWLCNRDILGLHVAHHIDASEFHSFSRFQENGTIPSVVTDPSHCDNLFPLCPHCHVAYSATFPQWVLIPDEETLQTYINHEKNDYEQRHSMVSSDSSDSVPPRSLPPIDRTKILYHPLIITHQYKSLLANRFNSLQWPKHWPGEPTTVIHRAARRGLFESTPVQPFRFPGKRLGCGRGWQTGVPENFQILVGELIRLWARHPPR